MTLEELLARESIRATMARYTMAGDRLKTDEFLAAFTEDAIVETDGVPAQDSFRYAGKAQIRGWMDRWRSSAATTQAGAGQPSAAKPSEARFIRHHLSTCQIEFTGADSASARTYWVAYTDIGPDHAGYYVDVFRKEDGEWLIAHRKIRLDWRRSDSLYQDAVERTR